MGEKHGQSDNPVYKVWVQMNHRCRTPSAANYARYGGRGIKVCESWQTSFAAFCADMGPRPPAPPRYSIDRINNDGDYEPGNCRWATRKEQDNNRSNNTLITHGGKTLTVTLWAEAIGITPTMIFKRMSRGWPQALILSPERHSDTSGLALGAALAAVKRKARKFCKRGHRFTAKNTYTPQSKNGGKKRVCRACKQMHERGEI